MVIIKKSEVHGKGVFALEKIPSDTILTCDVIEVPKGLIINDYIYPYIGDRVCIHAGFGSYFNSSKEPNVAHIKIDITENISYFRTIKNINKGEELFLRYL